jgi:curli biogenesis system outer membrane secretion channel CsgG
MQSFKTLAFSLGAFALVGCAATEMQMGSERAKTTATGSAGGETATNANAQLERCDKPLGTMAVVEDTNAPWYHYLTRQLQLPATTPVLRLLVQQSNCFVVVDRGRAMQQMAGERALESSGELRQGSQFGKGQMVAADYAMTPSITFSSNDTGGVGGGVGAIGRAFGSVGVLAGAVAGGLKFREASTMLTLTDNRSGVQVAAAEGSSSKADFNLAAGLFGAGVGGAVGGGAGGYTKTPEGKVLVAAFTDSYNQMVRALKNYRPQTIDTGLGTGGKLQVQGGVAPGGGGGGSPAKPAGAPGAKK